MHIDLRFKPRWNVVDGEGKLSEGVEEERGEDGEGKLVEGVEEERGEDGEGEGVEDGLVGDVGHDGDKTKDGLFGDVGEEGEGGDVAEFGEQGEGGDDGEVGQGGEGGDDGEVGQGGEGAEDAEVGDVSELGEEGEGGDVSELGEEGEGGDDGEVGQGAEGAEVGDVGEVGRETEGADEVQEKFDFSSWIGSDEEAPLSEDEFVDVDEQLEQQNCEGNGFVEMGTRSGCTTSNFHAQARGLSDSEWESDSCGSIYGSDDSDDESPRNGDFGIFSKLVSM
ncbi:hypothetical protein LR48_Vigan07g256500 [Vigna angularis]|uniref:Uncharacterized protein n=1 Tax=Phaseolus angularis TaxID=3914 RepID=A0A0L9V1M7_PHAAN|nr:hypothetical protein LR48_Vigan07g256500 [Vigna angularis]